jgi:hypothetical protein
MVFFMRDFLLNLETYKYLIGFSFWLLLVLFSLSLSLSLSLPYRLCTHEVQRLCSSLLVTGRGLLMFQ